MKLEARTFDLDFPDGWSFVQFEQPVVVAGPRGEQVMVSAYFSEDAGSPDLSEELERTAVQSIKEGASDPGLVEVTPMKRGQTWDGSPFFEMHSRSADGRTSFSQFAAVSLRTSVFVTYEADATNDASIPIVREVVRNVTWTPDKKRFGGKSLRAEGMKYSGLAGLGMVMIAVGILPTLAGIIAKGVPAFVLPLGILTLVVGVALVVKNMPKAREYERERQLWAGREKREEVWTRPYPPEGESGYPHSLDRLPAALEPLAEQVRGLAQPCVHLTAEQVKEPLALTASKFGGVPYLTEGETWPACPSGKPMTFIGQLNFGEIAAVLSQKGERPPADMPTRGILGLFYDMETMAPGLEKDAGDYCRFVWHEDVQETGGMPSVPEQFEAPFECRLVPSARPSVPSPGDEVYRLPVSSESAKEAYNKLQVGIVRSPVHQVLGHAALIQNDPRPYAHRSPVGREVGGAARDWRLLWQIDTDEDGPGFMWGDAGIFRIFIHDRDLKARRFDRLQYDWQCY